MNRNTLYIVVIAILVVIIGYLGWQYYQDQNSAGVEINMDENGMSVETN